MKLVGATALKSNIFVLVAVELVIVILYVTPGCNPVKTVSVKVPLPDLVILPYEYPVFQPLNV